MIYTKFSVGSFQDFVKEDTSVYEKIQLLQFLVKELDLKEITRFAEESNISDKTARNRINKGKIPRIYISNTSFIINRYFEDML